MSEASRGVCVVIGAGDGLGASVARAFAREGFAAVVTRRARHLESLQTLAESIRAEGGEAHAFGLDARNEAEMAAFFDEVERTIGAIEVLVFNIGANVRFPVVETTAQVYSKVWEMAAFAGFLAGREAARVMASAGQGDDPVHRRDREPSGRRGFFRVRRRETRLARAGAEPRARTRSQGRACRPHRHRRRDRRRVHPLHYA